MLRRCNVANRFKNIVSLINQQTSNLPVEQMFLNDLKKSIEMDDMKNSRKPSQAYKPSSMNCIRNMYYQVTGTEPDAEHSAYNLVCICNSGSDTHERIQGYVLGMRANGIDCEYINVADFVEQRNLDYLDIMKKPDFENKVFETKLFHKKLNMSFLCDGIIRYKDKYYILELKTETNNKWYNRDGVDTSHYNQATAYSIAFGISDVLFVYIDRDMFNMKAFMFTPTNEMKEELIGKITECDGYVQRMVTPPKPDDVAKKTCNYCNYASRCRRD
jgi:hypothetical protein